MLIAGLWAGSAGAFSAFLGGVVNVTGGAVFGWVATRSSKRSPGEVLRALLRAEAAKVALIVLQLALILTHYKQVVPAAFFGTFILTVILFTMAIYVRD
jgi:ATP synthase protein I